MRILIMQMLRFVCGFTCLCCQRLPWQTGNHPCSPTTPSPQQPDRPRASSRQVLVSCCQPGYDCWLHLQAKHRSVLLVIEQYNTEVLKNPKASVIANQTQISFFPVTNEVNIEWELSTRGSRWYSQQSRDNHGWCWLLSSPLLLPWEPGTASRPNAEVQPRPLVRACSQSHFHSKYP